MMADMRPVTTSMSEVLFGLTGADSGGHGGRPAAPAVVNPVEVWTGLPWTPQAVSGWLEFAKDDAADLPAVRVWVRAGERVRRAFILGSTMRGLGTVGKDILGVQTPMEKMGKRARRAAAPTRRRPRRRRRRSRRRCRGVRDARRQLEGAPAAAQPVRRAAPSSPASRPPPSRQRCGRTHGRRRRRCGLQRNDLDITADEAAAAKAYALGDSRGLAKTKLEARAEAKDRWGKMKEKMTGFKTQVDWGPLRIKTGRRARLSPRSPRTRTRRTRRRRLERH